MTLGKQKIPYVPSVVQKFDLWRMNYRKSTFVVPKSPHFGNAKTTEFFRSLLANASVLIEFGAGGSTYLAASVNLPFVTVESDSDFLEAMKSQIFSDKLFNEKIQIYLHRSIGRTRRWGRPLILEKVTESRQTAMIEFSDFPVVSSAFPMANPVILIDGRFRVACALKAIRFLHGKNFKLLVDDYRSRRSYGEIAKFAQLERMEGRMGVFVPKLSIDKKALDKAIYDYELDWR
jgi:hypothetical protein